MRLPSHLGTITVIIIPFSVMLNGSNVSPRCTAAIAADVQTDRQQRHRRPGAAAGISRSCTRASSATCTQTPDR